MSYALVAGHTDDPKSAKKTEVLYVNGTTKVCHTTTNYPENVEYVSGNSFLKDNLIVACGGGDPLTSSCYSMSNDLKWTHFANLTTRKEGIASAIVKNGLWVTGNVENFSLNLRMYVHCAPLMMSQKVTPRKHTRVSQNGVNFR